MTKDFRLDDEVLGHIAKLIQLALLTGTDVVDNLRMLRVSFKELELDEEGNHLYGENMLVLSDEYRANSDAMIEKMIDDIARLSTAGEQDLLES